MTEHTENKDPREKAVDLPARKLTPEEEKGVRGGYGPIDGKKPPVIPFGPVDGQK